MVIKLTIYFKGFCSNCGGLFYTTTPEAEHCQGCIESLTTLRYYKGNGKWEVPNSMRNGASRI